MEQKKKPLTSRGLLITGLIFACMGILARALAHGITGDLEQAAMEQLLLQPGVHALAILTLVLETLAVGVLPIFSVLVADGFHKGENTKRLLIGLGALAILSEVPYNLVMLGKPFDMSQQNPVFGLVICVAVLAIYSHFPGKSFGTMVIWAVATVGAVMLCYFLRVEYGLPLLLSTLVTWAFRSRTRSRMAPSVISCLLCLLLSPFYLGALAGLLPIYFYGGQHSEKKYLPFYVSYPAAMLVGWGITLVMQHI